MHAPAPDIIAPITAVTVFRANRALVTRSAPLPGGQPAQLRFSNLPLALADGSLRVRIDGSRAIASDLAVTIETAAADATLPPADSPELRAAILAERLATVAFECADGHRKRLAALSPPPRAHGPRGTPPPPSPTAARLALIDFQQSESARAAEECAKLRERSRLATETREQEQAKISAASNARSARSEQARKTVIVALIWPTAESTTTGTIHLDYLIPGARWTPACAIRLDRTAATAAITLRAAVAQRTGEDWHQARLTLSTADALAWHKLPELASLRIGRRQATSPRPGYRPAPDGADALFADFLASIRAEQAARQAEEQRSSLGAAAGSAAAAPVLSARAMEPEQDVQFGYSESAAPPPPAVAAAPMRGGPPPMPKKSMKMKSDLDAGEMTKDRLSASGSRAPGSARRSMMKKEAAPDDEVLASVDMAEGGGGFSADAPPVQLELHQGQLDYHDLFLVPPEGTARGHLTPMTVMERYRRGTVIIDTAIAMRLMTSAEHAAESLRALAKPARCHEPETPRFAYAYRAAVPVDVPADGAWHTVALNMSSAPTTLDHIVVPRESRDVFRVLTLANPFDAPLLAGPADIYSGDDYLMTTDLAFTLPGAQVALGLGVEPAIAVARNTTYEETAAGLLGGSTVHTHRIAIAIANKLAENVTVEVRERLPVAAPGVDDIKLKIITVAPAWEDFPANTVAPATANGGNDIAAHADHDRLHGGHRWRVAIPAAANRDLSVTYSITIPARNEVVGGNRREG